MSVLMHIVCILYSKTALKRPLLVENQPRNDITFIRKEAKILFYLEIAFES